MLLRVNGDDNTKKWYDQAYIAWFTSTRDTTDEITVKWWNAFGCNTIWVLLYLHLTPRKIKVYA